MKIASIVGARPQFVKLCAVSAELRKHHKELIVHTGQHYDYRLSQVFFSELQIPDPDYHLGVGSGSHCDQLGEMLKSIGEVLVREKPDLVLVFGDTNSTLGGALAASKAGIMLGHVEAGLRSFDRSMPEEVNRILADHCADLHFCPTASAVGNLAKEGIVSHVYFTGNVMADALHSNLDKVRKSPVLDELGLKSKEYLLATIHRQGNTDCRENLEAIVDALCQIEETVVFPVHPRTENRLNQYGLLDRLVRRVRVTQPLGYLSFLALMSHARRVLTDSGGVQEEAYMLRVPCVTLRDNTERTETVSAGWNVLVGTDAAKIVAMARQFDANGEQVDVYPPGASRRIVETLSSLGDSTFCSRTTERHS